MFITPAITRSHETRLPEHAELCGGEGRTCLSQAQKRTGDRPRERM